MMRSLAQRFRLPSLALILLCNALTSAADERTLSRLPDGSDFETPTECALLSNGVRMVLSKHATTQHLTDEQLERIGKYYADSLFWKFEDFITPVEKLWAQDWRAQLTPQLVRLALHGRDCSYFSKAAATRRAFLQELSRHFHGAPGEVLNKSRTPHTSVAWTRLTEYILETKKNFPDVTDEQIESYALERLRRRVSRLIIQGSHFMVDTFFAALAQSLDPHSRYFGPFEDYSAEYSKTGSLGITVAVSTPQGLLARAVSPTSDAYAQGILPGDQITAINGASTLGWDSEDFFEFDQRTEGDSLSLTILRPNGTVKRARIKRILPESQQSPTNLVLRHIEGHAIIHAKIKNFDSGMAQSLREALILSLASSRVDAIVLDLRGNRGGLVREATELLGFFLPDQTLALTEVQARGHLRRWKIRSQEPPLWNGPLTVLVDQYSASAAEITAGVLQDLDRALVIGEQGRTYGKGSIQDSLDAADNFPRGQFKYTTGIYYFPSGRSPQLAGVPADLSLGAELKVDQLEDFYPHAIHPENLAPLGSLHSRRPSASLNSSECLAFGRTGLLIELKKLLREMDARDETEKALLLTATFADHCAKW